jgi:glycine cleavage system regulatory protein
MVTQKTKARAAKGPAAKERAVITVNDIDHSDIIAAITRALADLDVNIED